MGKISIDELIEIIEKSGGSALTGDICDVYGRNNGLCVTYGIKTQLDSCLRENTDKVYHDENGCWHICTSQQSSVQTVSDPLSAAVIYDRDDVFFKTKYGKAFIQAFDYISTQFYIKPITGVKTSTTNYDQRSINGENNICYDFYDGNELIGVLYYKNGKNSTFTSFEVKLCYLESVFVDTMDKSCFEKYQILNKEKRHKFVFSDFSRAKEAIKLIFDQVRANLAVI